VSSRIMHVVAHEDDDLLFMNPDVISTIQGGVPVLTVYLTAGNISGNGDTDGARTRSRQLGIQAAYTAMAQQPTGASWTGAALTIAGRAVERYTLDADPNVTLVFVNLPDSGLSTLFSGQSRDTILADGGVVQTTYTYAHADVVALLTGLMAWFTPTVLRAQDVAPDPRWGPFAEHLDHIAAAKFVAEAQAAYAGGTVASVSYRCYNIAGEAVNLDPATSAEKAAIFGIYTPFDKFASDNGWTQRMLYRWGRGASWAGTNADGRPQIFVVRSGTAYMYWQTPAGGWAGPQALPSAGGPLAPTISVGHNADGRIEIFGLRLSDFHIVTIYQTQVNGGWAARWADLGSPNPGSDQIGVPVVANNGDGRMEIFVKNAGGGVCTKYQTQVNGGWSGWVDLHGTEVLDALAAVTNPAGCIELFAATHTGVLHWYQDQPNVGFTMNLEFPAPCPASKLSAVLSQDGTILVAYRLAGSGEVAISRQLQPAGGWADAPVVLGAAAGLGAPSMVRGPPGGDGCVLAFSRTYGGTLMRACQQTANGDFGEWTPVDGASLVDFPAACLDTAGRVVLFQIGLDNQVYLRTQVSATPGADFGPWQQLP
jgi:LmbE family N-acetylglucosaminyl deacetylase